MNSYSILADEIVTVVFVSGFSTTDTQRGLHDGFKWTCSSLYIWRCHISFSGASKLGDAFESKQLPLPRAKAHRVCGLIRLSEKRVGNPSQLPQSLHLTCEYLKMSICGKEDICKCCVRVPQGVRHYQVFALKSATAICFQVLMFWQRVPLSRVHLRLCFLLYSAC